MPEFFIVLLPAKFLGNSIPNEHNFYSFSSIIFNITVGQNIVVANVSEPDSKCLFDENNSKLIAIDTSNPILK
ncbi:MAG: hypothetical protein ABF260_07710 [Flavobacteriaceae bacterium]